MATEFYCDYCGEKIAGKAVEVWAGLGIARHDVSYCGPAFRGDESSCYEQAVRALSDMAAWAHRGEGSELQWRLVGPVAQQRAERAAESRKRLRELPSWPLTGTPLGELGLHPSPASALRNAGIHTLEAAAEHSETELCAIKGVSVHTVVRIVDALRERGMDLRAGLDPGQVGERIRALRERAGLTRQDFAEALRLELGVADDARRHGLYESDVATWERARQMPDLERLQGIAGLCNTSVEWLLYDDEPAGEPAGEGGAAWWPPLRATSG